MMNGELVELLEQITRRLRANPSKVRVNFQPQLCAKQKEAARMLDVSVDHFSKLGIKSVPVGGRCRRYRVEDLRAYLDRQADRDS